MAITVLQSPQASGFVSAHEEVWHVVDSTNKAVPGFKYIFDIYKGTELLTRVANTPYGSDGYGVLNVGNIVRSGLQTSNIADLNLTTSYTSGLYIQQGASDFFFTEYIVNYGEICGTTIANAPNIIPNLNSSSCRVYNTYNRNTLDKAGVPLNGNTIFLTNRPDNSYFYQDEPVVLSISDHPFITTSFSFSVTIQDANGFSGNTSGTYNDSVTYFSINQAKVDFNVIIKNGNDAPVAQKKLFKRCSKYTPYTLIFLNAYGGFDSFTFVNGNIITDNEKKRFEQMEWKLNGFNMTDRTGKVKYEGMKTYATKFKTKMKLTSDLLDTDEYKWLFELIVSPLVYIYDKPNNLLHPVQITDTNYEMKNSLRNKAEFIEVNIDVYDQNTQYR